jgi:hypothetical protein
LHFKLATRKLGTSSSRPSSSSSIINKQSTTNQGSRFQETNAIKTSKTNETNQNDKGFEKAFKESLKESNLDKRLDDLKSKYESTKIDELMTKLADAEHKNEYLTNLIEQLQQKKRNVSSAHR